MSQGIKFGTDGWRGIIGKDFNLENVEVVAQAIGDYLRLKVPEGKPAASYGASKGERLKVAVGYDTRRLSREAAQRISQVLTANKIKVILARKPLPTQAISYTVRSCRCAAGIMVTASHNPCQFNGIKIKSSFGAAVESKITDQIEGLILRQAQHGSNTFDYAQCSSRAISRGTRYSEQSRTIFKHKPAKFSLQRAQKLNLFKVSDLVGDYLKFVQSYLDMPLLKKGRLKVLADSMHGTADSYIAKLLKDTPCKVTTIHKDPDFSFGGIKPEPIQSCLRETSLLIRRKRFDVGLATDGDADRIAALDSQGRFINPQQIISLLLLHLIRYRRLKGAVVKTISGTALLERIAKKYGLKIYETPVGFKHISHLMQTKNILIGGEEAGGIGFKNYLPERDGILAGLLLLEMLVSSNKSLAALLKDMEKEFGRYFYLRKDLKCLSGDREKLRKRLANLRRRRTFSGTGINRVRDYDGLKFYLACGSWILFRLSGTESILRIYAEADSISRTRKLIAEGQRALKL